MNYEGEDRGGTYQLTLSGQDRLILSASSYSALQQYFSVDILHCAGVLNADGPFFFYLEVGLAGFFVSIIIGR